MYNAGKMPGFFNWVIRNMVLPKTKWGKKAHSWEGKSRKFEYDKSTPNCQRPGTWELCLTLLMPFPPTLPTPSSGPSSQIIPISDIP